MFDIDLVYLWVDGNDPKWQEKRDAALGRTTISDANCQGRYADNDELKYSLRSVEKYAPWIRKIFIVSDNQIPKWLNTSNLKIQVVDHAEILPPKCLPCFSSHLLEHHIHLIPGLSEHFLFANDDMFFNQQVMPETFFAADGLPIIRFNRRPFRKLTLFLKQRVLGKEPTSYLKAIHNSAMLVEKKYGHYYSGKTHHNIDAYLKSSYRFTRELFRLEIDATLGNSFRNNNDLQRNLYSYVALAENKAHLCYVTQRISFRLHIDNKQQFEKLNKSNPVFFCMNDSQHADVSDRKMVAEFLDKKFPNKSQYEK